MRYLKVGEALNVYRRVMRQSGGLEGVRDLGLLESAISQPRMTFNEQDLYPSIVDKAAALGFSLIQNHPFIDGNKRIGHAAMEEFLLLNGFEISAPIDGQVEIILSVAAGKIGREEFTNWLEKHVKPNMLITGY